MKITITDANIFIDLIYVGLCDALFVASLEIHTTIHVYDELNDQQQHVLSKHVKKNRLTIHLNEPKDIPKAIQENRGLSVSDKSVFGLAMSLNAFILTGDALLRKISNAQKIEVHGVIWLFDRFVAMELISKETAVMQLKRLMTYNKRLPVVDCEKRIEEWRMGMGVSVGVSVRAEEGGMIGGGG